MKTVEIIERLWIPLFGLILLVIVSLLARGIAINHITQEGSFGLEPLLVIISVLATKWADRAFHYEASSKKEDTGRNAVSPAGQPNQQ